MENCEALNGPSGVTEQEGHIGSTIAKIALAFIGAVPIAWCGAIALSTWWLVERLW